MKNLKFIVLFLFVILFFGCASSANNNESYRVKIVLDGDTVILTNYKNVRYIGINTPELMKKIQDKWISSPKAYAVEACDFNKRLVLGKKVRLEFDEEREDRYKRWLAYVFVDGKMVNEELLRCGLATLYTRKPNIKYLDRLKAAEKEAKDNKRGLWSLNPQDVR